jgi:hypothetical protein
MKRLFLSGAMLLLGAGGAAAQTGGVEAQPLRAVGLWGVGAAGAQDERFGPDPWRNADPGVLEIGFERLRPTIKSPTGQALAQRLLAMGAPAPQGAETTLGEARIAAAHRILPPQRVAEMLTRVGRLEESDALAPIAIDARFASGASAEACALVQARPDSIDAAKLKARALCFALNNEGAAADLAAEVARGQGVRDDWFFASLARRTGASNAQPQPARFASGADVALSLGLGLAAPGAWTADLPAARLAGLALRADAPLSLRLAAAGPSATAGTLAGAQHAELLNAALDAARAATPPATLAPALQRWAAVRDAADPLARADAVLAAIAAGRTTAERAALARALAVQLRALAGAEAAAPRAAELADWAVLAGEIEAASTLRLLAQTSAPPARLAALDVALAVHGRGSDPDTLAITLARRMEAASDEAGARRVGREIALLQAAGLRVPAAAKRFALARGVPAGARPSSAVMAGLRDAAERGAQGETALLAVLALSDPEPEALDGDAGASLVRALIGAGLDADARALASELILAAQNPPPRPSAGPARPAAAPAARTGPPPSRQPGQPAPAAPARPRS